jgi:hypothetical protein
MIQGTSMLIGLLLCGLAAGWVMAQDAAMDKPDPSGTTQVGYAVISPVSGSTAGLVVFETFGEHRMSEVTQAGVLPSDMTTHSLLFVNASGRLSRNLGVAIANPAGTTANITLTLKGEDGVAVATKKITVTGHYQTARFVTELFAGQASVPSDFTGTLDITSDVPVAVAGLRFRGQNFSTLPVTTLSLPAQVPIISTGVGGAGAIILAHMAIGGGWAIELVIVNTSAAEAIVRLDLFTNTGTAMTATLNGQTQSSFTNIKIPAGGVVTLSQNDD